MTEDENGKKLDFIWCCSVKGCQKGYEKQGSLLNHIDSKHPEKNRKECILYNGNKKVGRPKKYFYLQNQGIEENNEKSSNDCRENKLREQFYREPIWFNLTCCLQSYLLKLKELNREIEMQSKDQFMGNLQEFVYSFKEKTEQAEEFVQIFMDQVEYFSRNFNRNPGSLGMLICQCICLIKLIDTQNQFKNNNMVNQLSQFKKKYKDIVEKIQQAFDESYESSSNSRCQFTQNQENQNTKGKQELIDKQIRSEINQLKKEAGNQNNSICNSTNNILMSKQKRPVEQEYSNSKEEEDDQQNGSSNGNDDDTAKPFECKCGKSYKLQSSLFNHVRIKHDDNKDEFVVKRNVKPGRPKNQEGNNRTQQKASKKEKKPDQMDESTWIFIKLFRNPVYQNLILTFKDCMRSSIESCGKEDEQIKQQYEIQRQQLFDKIKFPKADIKTLKNQTDFLLDKWGLLLEPSKKLNLYLSFIRAYIKTTCEFSQEKIDYLLEGWDGQNLVYYNSCLQILQKEYPEPPNNSDSDNNLNNSTEADNQQEEEYKIEQNIQDNTSNIQQPLENTHNYSYQPQQQVNALNEDDIDDFNPKDHIQQAYQSFVNNDNPNQFEQDNFSLMNPLSLRQPVFQHFNHISNQQIHFESYFDQQPSFNIQQLIGSLNENNQYGQEDVLEEDEYEEDDEEEEQSQRHLYKQNDQNNLN